MLKDKFQKYINSLKLWLSSFKEGAGVVFGKAKETKNFIAPLSIFLKNKRNRFILLGIIIFLVLIILFILFFPKPKEKLDTLYNQSTTTQIKQSNSTKIQTNKTQLQNLIQKANILFQNGQVLEALEIYRSLSLYSESISSFNLGVIKLRQGDYKNAISSFDNVINSGENVSVAALNAAISAYKLGDLKSYNKYIELSKNNLIAWYDKPLYSYLYTLVHYYSNNYFHTLSSLNNPSSNFYPKENSALLAQMYLMFNDNDNALKVMLENPSDEDSYAIALLYARMGDYENSYAYVDSYLRNVNALDPQALIAKALIDIKRSNFIETSGIYENLLKDYDEAFLKDIYPIKIKLKDSLFDINEAQKTFWNIADPRNNKLGYKMLFYFAPYRVFNINEALNLLESGGLSLRMNNLQEAKDHLLAGNTLSKVNLDITEGIREILRFNIHRALKILIEASKKYPQHNLLQYNLGLIYAQLDDFENAYNHFIKAYHLDGGDILSGVFALMCAQLTNKPYDRILNEVTLDLDDGSRFKDKSEEGFLRSLFGFVNGNLDDDVSWITSKNRNSLYYALNVLYSIYSKDEKLIINSTANLLRVTNNDLVADIFNKLAYYYNSPPKTIALNLFSFFKDDLKKLNVVYSGPYLARQIYIYMAYLVGANYYVDEILTNRFLALKEDSRADLVGILQALALNSIYSLKFQKALYYYNALIDEYKLDDANNYFLAGVAAIGAKDYNNAVALMQLSRLKSPTNYDSRYALALLYQSMGNFKLASNQFSQLGDGDYSSQFFDFDIDTSSMDILN